MSALGQKRTCATHKLMSALPPESDIKCDMPRVSSLRATQCRAKRSGRVGPIREADQRQRHNVGTEKGRRAFNIVPTRSK